MVLRLQLYLKAFMDRWGLATAQPMPSLHQMATLGLRDFVRPRPVKRGETLSSIALREESTEMELRVLNNLLSERAISAYESVFVPVTTSEQLEGKHLRFRRVGAMHRILPVRSIFRWVARVLLSRAGMRSRTSHHRPCIIREPLQ